MTEQSAMDARTDRKARFVVPLWPYDQWESLDAMVGAAQMAEEQGMYGVALSDHLVVPSESARQSIGRYWPDAVALATWIAARTERIKLVFHVLVLPLRNPVELAKRIATLDVLSGGRVVVGLGCGWLEEEFKVLGVPFAERGELFSDHLNVIFDVWGVNGQVLGSHFSANPGMESLPKPAQQPHPPVFIAGRSRGAMKRVVRHGTGWLPMSRSLDDFICLRRELEGEAKVIGYDTDIPVIAGIQLEGLASADRTSVSLAQGRDPADFALVTAWRNAGVSDFVAWFPWRTSSDYMGQVQWLGHSLLPQLAEPTRGKRD